MKTSSFFATFQLLLSTSLLLTLCHGQLHEFRIQKGKIFPTTAAFNSYTTDATLRYGMDKYFLQSSATQFCAYGMWALYDTINFGEQSEKKTSVITVRGTTTKSCANFATTPGIRKIRSALYLGNAYSTNPGLVIYSEPNFLGSRYIANPWWGMNSVQTVNGEINSARLGSIAITGKGKFRICEDRDCFTAICIDTTKYPGSFYLNKDVAEDTETPWPAFVRGFTIDSTGDDCAMDGSPPAPVPESFRFENGTDKPLLEIF